MTSPHTSDESNAPQRLDVTADAGLQVRAEAEVQQPICARHNEPMLFAGGSWRCPECGAEQVRAQRARDDAARDAEGLRDAAEKRQAAMEARIGAAGIPERYRAHSFDSFPGTAPQALRNRDVLRAYANTWETNFARGISVLLVGAAGTGKTGLACAVANHVMRECGATAAFMSAYGAVRHQRDTWSRRTKTEREALNDLVLPDLLILDEVGASVGSDSEMAMLFEVLNGRYASMRPTMLISNLPIDDYNDGAARRPGLRTFLGPRVLDRYNDDGSFTLACDWGSLRGAHA